MTENNSKTDNSGAATDQAEPGRGNSGPAVNLARQKLEQLFIAEPDAGKEMGEIANEIKHHVHLSKHQKFVKQLNDSGLSKDDVNDRWHQYYATLSDDEKHEVWKEFYDNKPAGNKPEAVLPPDPNDSTQLNHPRHEFAGKAPITKQMTSFKRHYNTIVPDSTKRKARIQFKSIAVGLGAGSIVLLIMLFGLFNERIITPFITPSKTVTNTPIIGESVVAAGAEPKIVIPKINVEVPVIYTAASSEEKILQTALEDGVVHYPETAMPGQNGNGLLFGHSSNNIFNKGKYKFAFLLLKGLDEGDTFSLEKDGKRYVYKIFKKEIVKPTDTWVLNNYADKAATMTLMTCDPPGTSINRLIVVGEQISPATTSNLAAANVPVPNPENNILPSNSPSLWSRLWNFFGR